ncbi:MAG: phosphoribosylglycinamide formyltransferase [Spirochaetota bacterium]
MANCVILASGTGTNARAIATDPRISDNIAAIVSDRRKSPVLSWAHDSDFPAIHVDCRAEDRAVADERLVNAVARTGADFVVLAGFMRILGPRFIEAYSHRIVNIHPSLLPSYPGLHAIERSWEAGESRLGVTVHEVDQGVDTGPILAQAAILRRHVSTLSELYTCIHAIEHAMYPEIVAQVLAGDKHDCRGGESLSECINGIRIREALPQNAELVYPTPYNSTSRRML